MFLHPCVILLREQTPSLWRKPPFSLEVDTPPLEGDPLTYCHRLPLGGRSPPLPLPHLSGERPPWYRRLVVATEASGTHSNRMHSSLNYAFLHQIPKYQRSSM